MEINKRFIQIFGVKKCGGLVQIFYLYKWFYKCGFMWWIKTY